jgi:hypothetical protein
LSKLVTSGTGHDPVPVSVRTPRAPGRHPAVATQKLEKPDLVSRWMQKFFGEAAGPLPAASSCQPSHPFCAAWHLTIVAETPREAPHKLFWHPS